MKKAIIFLLLIFIPLAASAGDKDSKKKKYKDYTLEQFTEKEKKRAKRKGKEFNPSAVEARFRRMDSNGDGVLSAEEQKAKRKKKK